MAQGINLLDLHLDPVAEPVGAAVFATHEAVLAGAVLVPVVLEGTHVHQAFHLGGGHLHKEAVALNPTNHPRQHLAHQGFGLPCLGH